MFAIARGISKLLLSLAIGFDYTAIMSMKLYYLFSLIIAQFYPSRPYWYPKARIFSCFYSLSDSCNQLSSACSPSIPPKYSFNFVYKYWNPASKHPNWSSISHSTGQSSFLYHPAYTNSILHRSSHDWKDFFLSFNYSNENDYYLIQDLFAALSELLSSYLCVILSTYPPIGQPHLLPRSPSPKPQNCCCKLSISIMFLSSIRAVHRLVALLSFRRRWELILYYILAVVNANFEYHYHNQSTSHLSYNSSIYILYNTHIFPIHFVFIIQNHQQFEKMLPPGLENKKTHKYGYFQLQIDLHGIPKVRFLTVELSILGMGRGIRKEVGISDCVAFSFDIGTNLWMFYAYMHDARSIQLRIIDDEKKQYKSEIPLVIMASKQVLSKQPKVLQNLFQNNSFLMEQTQKIAIFDSKKSKIGQIQSTIHLTFFQSINMLLFNSGLIQLQQILVIDEISPIVSTIQLPQNEQPPPKPIQSTQPLKPQIKQEILSVTDKNLNFMRTQSLPSMVEYISHPDDERQVDDDIERMMSQIYNRPYDSSKYLEAAVSQPRKQNVNMTNYYPSPINSNNKIENRSLEKVIANPPRYPPIMRNSQSRENSHSPFTRYSQTTILPSISMHQTQLVQRQRSIDRVQPSKTSRSVEKERQVDRKKGVIKLKIHQFTMTRMEKQLSIILKIYLNDDNDQFYTINGFRQGEVISFNSSLKIDQKRQISSIKFVLIDSYDMKTIFARGQFDTNRLFTLNPTKGVFIVNLLNAQQSISNSSKIIRVDESNIVPVVPSIKNLRIQVEFEDLIEIVQIYLSLSNFGNICKRVCYKIPFTKEKIEFRVGQLNNGRHINLFPHNRSSSNKITQKIIIELWQQFQLIGFSEINLKPLSNTNQQIINSSLQPIFLYDEIKQVTDIKTGKTKACFNLKLYYGTISQVQSLLNRQDRKQRRPQLAKSPVEVESHLGIYIKQSKSKKQVEIQVDNQQFMDKNQISKKSSMVLQQQVLPDDEDQDEEWDVSKNDSHNQFISQSMQQKLIENKQTNIIPNYSQKSQNISKSIDLSKTIKATNLKSLTKQFQEQISSALSDLAKKDLFDELKQTCRPHLLYNFIQIQKLRHIMKDFGIEQLKIDNIIRDILPSSNDMININILYDMVFALILDGDIKQKYIDDVQIGRFCLMVLYKQLHNLQEQFLFEEDTEFDESRKVYQKIGYKQTMREYNLSHMYIKRVFELQPNRSSVGIRDMLISHFYRKIAEVETKQAKKKEIISKIYQEQWDEEDDFFISNINQKQGTEEDTSINHNFSQTLQKENKLKFSAQISTIQKNKKVTQQVIPQVYYNEPSSERSFQSNIKDIKAINQSYQVGFTEQPKKAQSPLIRQDLRRKANCQLIIQGFQSCIETTQCLLNVPLSSAKLRISCKTGGSLSQFQITNRNENDTYQIQMYLQQTQFVDGSIQLLDCNKTMAKCNVSIMANMKSCYSLKNLQTFQFSGIIKLLLKPFN